MIEMITIKEACKRTGLAYNAVRHLCLEKRIAYFNTGKKFMINWESLQNFLNLYNGESKEAANE